MTPGMTMRRTHAARRARHCAAVLVLFGLPLVAAQAQDDLAALPADLTQLSLDDLLKIEITSVSKRAEPLQQAAAAVFVLSGEQIRRSGVRSIAEALRQVPGLHVARRGQEYAISARGFNSTTADKLEVLIDGRSVYTPLFSGVFWDALDTYLPDIERIEVIRGPGATLWGANAVNGVINIITRSARDTQGLQLDGSTGNNGTAAAAARGGWALGKHAYGRLYAQHRENDNGARPDGSEPPNGLSLRQTGFRVDGDISERQGYTLSGDWYEGTTETASGDTEIDGGNLLGRWNLRQSDRSELRLLASLSHSTRLIRTLFDERRDTFDLELEHQLRLGQRHDLVYGLGYRYSRDATGGPPLLVIFDPDRRNLETIDGFIQDQIRLGGGAGSLTVGTKLEYNDFTGFEIQPGIRLGWNLYERVFTWAAVSRAVRTPNRLDSDIAFFCPASGMLGTTPCTPDSRIRIGNADLHSEKLTAYEWGLRATPVPRLSLDLALYYNDYDELRSVESLPPFGPLDVRFENQLAGSGSGGDLTLGWLAREDLRLYAWYNNLRLELRQRAGGSDTVTENTVENGNPRHQAGIGLDWTPAPRWRVDALLRHVGELEATRVPAYTDLNLRLAWRPRPNWELGLVGENLFDPQHPEFGAASANRIEVERLWLLQLRWWPQ